MVNRTAGGGDRTTPLANPRGLVAGARFLARVPGFVRRRFTLEEARSIQAARLRERESRFVDLLGRVVFERPGSVLSRLFQHAGVAHDDLCALVERDGLEGALRLLFREGVYLTVDEFKGRKPVLRGSLSIEASTASFRNPLAAFHVAARSGGSRSASPPFLIDLAYVRACAVACAVYLDAHGGWGWRNGTWETPGAGSRFRLLKFSCFGSGASAWFTQVDPALRSLDPVFRWSERAMRWGTRVGGRGVPRPVVATPEEPLPVARWARRILDEGETPHLLGPASSFVRLASAALEAGIDLEGARATLGGEPITAARLRTLRGSGIVGRARYGSIETGPVAYGCGETTEADYMHVVRDLHAVIQAGARGSELGMPENALLLTTLHPAAPYSMINFCMGDQADFVDAPCPCRLERLGWHPRIQNVRSFEKLTAGGVTFQDAEVVRLLEVVLPSRFGGHPTDYQLVEDEDSRGDPGLVIRVHPRVGPISEPELIETFLTGLGAGSPVNRLMEEHLRSAVRMRVERGTPHVTRSSKILHLHGRRTR